MNLLEINVFILWFQSEFWNDACGNEIAIFSYQRGEKIDFLKRKTNLYFLYH